MGVLSRVSGFISRAADVVQEQVQAVVPSGQEAAHAVIAGTIATNPAFTAIDALTGAGSHYLPQDTAQTILAVEGAVAAGAATAGIGTGLAGLLGASGAAGTVAGTVAAPAGARAGIEAVGAGIQYTMPEPSGADVAFTDPGYSGFDNFLGASPVSEVTSMGNVLFESDLVAAENAVVLPGGSNPTQAPGIGTQLLNLFGLAPTSQNMTQASDDRPRTFDLAGAISGFFRGFIGSQDQASQGARTDSQGTNGAGFGAGTLVILGVAAVAAYFIFRKK